MRSAATKAQNLVFAAAQPIEPGEQISAQKKRAFKRLRLHQVSAGDSKLHNAWHGRANFPTYAALLHQAEEVGLVRVHYTTAADGLKGDDEFYGGQVVGMHLTNGKPGNGMDGR